MKRIRNHDAGVQRIYECTVYYGDSPWILEGCTVQREIVAATAGKARYSYWRDLHESWQEIRLQDIRVRSLAKRKAEPMVEGWENRLSTANGIIRVMASHGRRFFSQDADRRERLENPSLSQFSVDQNGELWFTDAYTQKPSLVRHRDWPHFHNGGTLRAIVEHLGAHITKSNPINPRYFMRSPKWVCDGDLWGYGEDMLAVEREIGGLIACQEACSV